MHLNDVDGMGNSVDCKKKVLLSYDIAVIQWITSCLKNGMTTRVITLWRVDITSLTTFVSTMRFTLK